MKSLDRNLFTKVTKRPTWEGVIFIGLDVNDPRILISKAEPNLPMKDYVESIWFMQWDLASKESLKCILVPNPCAKLVVLRQNDKTFPPIAVGAKMQAEFFELSGSGATIGFDFQPGGLFPFLNKSLDNWPNSGIPFDHLIKEFPLAPQESWGEIGLSNWIKEIQDFLSATLESANKNSFTKISRITNCILEGSIKSPDDMVVVAGTSLRSLQRIFQKEVGVSPRDLLRIARFNEAICKISENDFSAYADIALASGFFDQPHMANEFQKLVATPPAKFRRYL